ncbi:ABC-type multidrug transport system, ATPase component [Corynebacterium mustelae]|uniref:ABC-type multidrug transport system, ATPase component n=1 Tax=Corynebacterium mustelae TaxID=571915 RepID=A0A0G3GU77_9CORY|nr:ABC transporter ATP-binding protein [Corynebacterium mustelae]AKK04669.1 ABC-type multidrug transport system, ATPase component [Corynebacterium mustelae]
MTDSGVICLDSVSKTYPSSSEPAVSGLSFSVQANEIVCILGPNGSGKTTTIEMISGLLSPSSGRVTTLGVDPVKDRDTIRANVAVQPQHASLFENQTALEIVTFWRSLYSKGYDPTDVLGQLGLLECRNVRVSNLSGGQRQRVLLALALVSKPSMLILDEPSTGLDLNAKHELWNAIRLARENGATVLLSTHDMEEAEALNDKVALFSKGRLVAFDSSTTLISNHSATRVITAKLPNNIDPSQLSHLNNYGADVSCEIDSDGVANLKIKTSDSDSCFKALSNLHAFDIRINDTGLSGVFQKLTGSEWSNFDGDGIES